MRNKYLLFILAMIGLNPIFGQDSIAYPPLSKFRIFEANLTNFAPNSFEGENFHGNIQTRLYRAKIQLPVKLKDQKTILNNSVEFAFLNPVLANSNFALDSKLNFYSFSYGLNYIRKLGTKRWVLIASVKPTLASDFQNSLIIEDFLFQGSILISKRLNRFTKIGFGGVHDTKFGKNPTLPLLQLMRNKGNHETDILLPSHIRQSYSFGENKIGANIYFTGGAYNFDTPTNFKRDLDKFIFSKLNAGLEYEVNSDKNLAVIFNLGYTVFNRIEFLNQAGDTELAIKPKNDLYASIGVVWQK